MYIGHLIAQSLVLHIIKIENLTIHNIRIAARVFRHYSPSLTDEIEAFLKEVENKKVLEQVQCCCERIKCDVIFEVIHHIKGMLVVLAAADEDEKERQQEQFGLGPMQVEFTSLFPKPNELSRAFAMRKRRD